MITKQGQTLQRESIFELRIFRTFHERVESKVLPFVVHLKDHSSMVFVNDISMQRFYIFRRNLKSEVFFWEKKTFD